MNVEDDWRNMPPSAIALASVWPLVEGDHIKLHDDPCALYHGGEECDCTPLILNGPSGFA